MDAVHRTPEQQARQHIDRQLVNAGWVVQDLKAVDFAAAAGVAVREYPTAVGPADYVLFVDRRPLGVIEAKPESEGHRLSVVEEQSSGYAAARLKWVADDTPLPFVYESTGTVTRFRDERDPLPRSRPVFGFHQPATLAGWQAGADTLRGHLRGLPALPAANLRDCQIRAIGNLEVSLAHNRPRALVQMATGSGKTFTAITAIYRLLKFAGARRVLFVVDTRNLGEQAEQEFMAYVPADDPRKFTELYNVQRLKSGYVAPSSQVCISTIQRLYAILRGQPLDEAAEAENPAERRETGEPVPVAYNAGLPPEFFDVVVIDECHRSIYNLWKQVLDYFDAFLIGLTATPDKRTFGFFHENVVSEYSHEDAVADGVNVGYTVFEIDTAISRTGAALQAREYVDTRNRLTRERRWTQLEDDLQYQGKQLDRDVVNPSQIRTVVRAFRDSLPAMFPGRREVPKTLVFAKTDSHADDIIAVVREEFGAGNAFCKKVTYQAKEDPKSVLAQFRNDYYPRIAVTVDMIATGTDVRPLECLLFMRDVKSRNYFEQMKGRGTRVLGGDDLRKVTPSAAGAKTHFVVVDAVGVTRSVKSDSRPLEQKPSVALKDLLMGVMMGQDRSEASLLSLAGRLSRLAQRLEPAEVAEIQQVSGGETPNTLARRFLEATDPDRQLARARADAGLAPGVQPTDEQLAAAKRAMADEAAAVLSGPLVEALEGSRRRHEQIIDEVNLDRVEHAGWSGEAAENAGQLTGDFAAYIAGHRDEIAGLRFFYDQPLARRALTLDMVKEVLARLKLDRPALAPLRVWQAYALLDGLPAEKSAAPKSELTVLVALIRRASGMDERLTAFDQVVGRNFQRWVMDRHKGNAPKFSEAQLEWLRMMRDHIAASFSVERDDLEYAPFDGRGGLGRMYQLFGEGMDAVMAEMNRELVG